MKHRITIKLPYPISGRVFSFNRKRTIGFSFDNLCAFLMRESLGLKTGDDLKQWIKKNGNERLWIETIWAAAKSYNAHEKGLSNFNLDYKRFLMGLQQMKEDDKAALLNAYNHSNTFGMKQTPGKKKAAEKS